MSARILAFAVVLITAGGLVGQSAIHAGQELGGDAQYRVRIAAADPGELRAALERDGYDVLGTSADAVDVAASLEELSALQRKGFAVISVEEGRPLNRVVRKQSTARDAASVSMAAVTPGYRDLNGVLARMQEIAAAYPAIAQRST